MNLTLKRKSTTPAGEVWEIDVDDTPTQPLPRQPDPNRDPAAGDDEGKKKDTGR
jgi:hypothetical protein